VCSSLSEILKIKKEQILPFSTGVIMEALPVEKLTAALPGLKDGTWLDAAEAIMTTDTVPKAFSAKVKLSGGEAVVTGIAKGAGMIHPDMATMLGFVATDARVSRPLLKAAAVYAAKHSFNCISVDGDTSTNDAFMLIASNQASMNELNDARSPDFIAVRDAVTQVAIQLAQAIVRDGEGATK